jgi:hypothetical protein
MEHGGARDGVVVVLASAFFFFPLFIEEAVALSVYGGRRGIETELDHIGYAETDYGAHETNKFNGIRSLCDRITPKIIEPNNT